MSQVVGGEEQVSRGRGHAGEEQGPVSGARFHRLGFRRRVSGAGGHMRAGWGTSASKPTSLRSSIG
jgi:hypothetical protein